LSLLPKARSKPATPYSRLGGREPIDRMVGRFYDLMETDPAFAGLHEIHLGDITEMREKLADFLTAWMGGPRDWFEKNPGACIMSAHGAMQGIDRRTAEQWMACMTRAAEEIAASDAALADNMLSAMASMCRTMAKRAEEKWTPHTA
jgi:hemoglobin